MRLKISQSKYEPNDDEQVLLDRAIDLIDICSKRAPRRGL